MKTITVISGKGGVGKTTITANLGTALSEKGYRVVLFDADLALANLDVLLGVKSDKKIQHAIEGEISIKDSLIESPRGVKVISGDSGVGKMIRLSKKRLEAFVKKTSDLVEDTDFLIYDAAAGIDPKVMTFACAADEVLLIVTPDPSSVIDAFATAKVLFRYKEDACIRVLINMVDGSSHAAKVFETLQAACKEFLHKAVFYAGFLTKDNRVQEFARQRKTFVSEEPRMHIAQDLLRVATLLETSPMSNLQMIKSTRASISKAA